MSLQGLYMTLQVMAADDPNRKRLVDRMVQLNMAQSTNVELREEQVGPSGTTEFDNCV